MERLLGERQHALLAAIVSDYVETKTPVGSDAIVRRHGPGVSPATIRNDMVALASAGFVCSTHTSSGRIPTNAGYRYFVRHLMRPAELTDAERRLIDHQFHQIERDHNQWLQLAATVLTHFTGNAAFVTVPSGQRARLRHLDVIATQDGGALLVAFCDGGTLHQQLVALPRRTTQEELDAIAHRATLQLRDATADEIDRWDPDGSPLQAAVRDSLASLMRRIDQQAVGGVWYEGMSLLLAEPEFARRDRAQEVLRCFEQRRAFATVAEAIKDYAGVQVFIGEENPLPGLADGAMVATRYGRDRAAGVIGVLGPTRMRYDRVIAVVQHLAGVMTELWAELRV
jgi:heat-inducible transcriptional repressor